MFNFKNRPKHNMSNDNFYDDIILNIVLNPNRSLTKSTFYLIIILLLIISISVGFFFYTLGAWPVIGFFGIDILFFTLIFYFHNKSLKISERIILTKNEMIIEKIKPFGKNLIVKFAPPNWINITIKKSIYNKSRLIIHSHGSAIFVGDFLTKVEKIQLADSLKNEINKFRI